MTSHFPLKWDKKRRRTVATRMYGPGFIRINVREPDKAQLPGSVVSRLKLRHTVLQNFVTVLFHLVG